MNKENGGKKIVLKMIISGGQTGADQGALHAGMMLGLHTGGTAPKGYKTEKGRQATLLRSFGLEEADTDHYPTRTKINVEDSDFTLWIGDVGTPGHAATRRSCKAADKDFLVNPSGPALVVYLLESQAEVMNVAGNRASTYKGIRYKVFLFLLTTLHPFMQDPRV